jgi:hypothetical protein
MHGMWSDSYLRRVYRVVRHKNVVLPTRIGQDSVERQTGAVLLHYHGRLVAHEQRRMLVGKHANDTVRVPSRAEREAQSRKLDEGERGKFAIHSVTSRPEQRVGDVVQLSRPHQCAIQCGAP